uniref:procollagen-lysine 5-dioxygenase n=1 Tax=Phallusia mammillata TaxID=59560 RepID=A0A6F9DPP2_9ASCI|nr:procollagen-lysine,2-oxoglutarate 5-dioxygenase 3-like [Phallusia mammillata]
MILYLLYALVLFAQSGLTTQEATDSTSDLDLLIVTVATDETDGYKRFADSLKYFNLDVLVLGMNEEWTGGDVRVTVGGGMKVNLLKKALGKYKDNQNLVLFFTDSYDVVFAAGKDEILGKFKNFNSKLIFSAETTIWPDASLKSQYPEVNVGKRFLCSGGIIGYAPQFWAAINQWDLVDTDDDQLYYTKLYLNEGIRAELNMSLDHTSKLVQNINFARSELELVEQETTSRVKNVKYHTFPSVIHGNGPSKVHLNYFSNYMPDGWHSDTGCRKCEQDLLDLSSLEQEDSYPLVQLSIFIEDTMPFFSEFLQRIEKLSYPKSRIALFIHNNEQTLERVVAQFLLRHRSKFNSVKVVAPHEQVSELEARQMAIERCVAVNCDYQFSVNADVQLTNPDTLNFLITKNKKVIAPLVRRPGKLWSNFWGALNIDGYYARSEDYLAIVDMERRGIWNIPFMNSVYLIKVEVLHQLIDEVGKPFSDGDLDPDMALCSHLRNEGVFIYLSNEYEFGHLVVPDLKVDSEVHPDLWQIKANAKDWEDKYIHPGFWNATLSETKVTQPCPDVYMFPLFTPAMADAIVELMEFHGKWSTGNNEDERLTGGYENVPTIDIHMNQVGYEKQWLHLLATYPLKVVQKVYPGYDSKAHSIMMFVVRYKPSEQPFLRPHHDSSTWTMNVALNTHGQDYEGGGCRFLRYNCSATQIPKGYALIHPGRLTHYHEGLQTTKGTRYIAVSFVDP